MKGTVCKIHLNFNCKWASQAAQGWYYTGTEFVFSIFNEKNHFSEQSTFFPQNPVLIRRLMENIELPPHIYF